MGTDAATMKRRPGALAAIGWALGAVVVAVAVSLAMEILFVDVLDAAIDPIVGGGVVPETVQIVGTALVVGAAIGGVVGSRVHNRAVVVALVTTAVYLGTWPFALLLSRTGGTAINVTLHFLAAGVAAWWMERRKSEERSA